LYLACRVLFCRDVVIVPRSLVETVVMVAGDMSVVEVVVDVVDVTIRRDSV
jgi:hypothetical protein